MNPTLRPISPYSWRSLQTRITLLTLSVFLVCIWSLSWYVTRILHQDVETMLGAQQLSTLTVHADNINRTLSERLSMLESAAQLIAPVLSKDPSQLQTLLENRPALAAFFNGGFFVTNIQGTALASYPASVNRVGVNYLDRAHIASALKLGESKISPPLIGKILKSPVVSVVVPMRNDQGQIVGSLVGVIDLGRANFLAQVMQARYGKTGGFMLLAPPWRLLFTPSQSQNALQTLPATGSNPALDRFAQGFEGSAVLINTEGVEVLASAKNIPLTGWNMVAMLPTAEAFAPVHTLIRNIQLAALAASLLAGALSWWLLRRQLAPIHIAFAALTRQTDSAQPLQALPSNGDDEVGQLIDGFNHLLVTLAQRENKLHLSESAVREALKNSLALTEQLSRFQHALDSHVLVTISDINGLITHANPRFCEVCGYTLAELQQHDFSLLNSGTHSKEFFAAMYDTLGKGNTWHGEICNRTKSGNLFWLAMTIVPFKGNDGQSDQYFTLNNDITERKAGEVELENYREHLEELVQQRTVDLHQAQTQANAAALYARSLIEASVDPLVTIDANGCITDLNQATESVTGVEREHLLGSEFSLYFTESSKAHSLYKMAFDKGQVNDYPLTVRHLSGQLVSVLYNASVYCDAEGQVLGVFAAARDVSALRAAQEAANAANHAKSAFLANMSHEIRTPMNGVVGMVDILQQSHLDNDQRRMLDTIYQSSLALLNIINDILDYSKIEAGKLSVENISTPLRDVTTGVVQLMQPGARAKDIDLSLWVSPELPNWVYSDPNRLRQVLLNLIGNAIKFTHTNATRAGHVAVRVASGIRVSGQAGLYVRISDNGIGMNDEAVAKLFTPFTQADAGIARQFGGTGLGLSISQRLVDLMGGRIKVHSKPNVGSEFTVELPLHEAPPGEQQGQLAERRLHPRPATPGVAQAQANGQLILLAEDNDTNREVLQEQLNLLGYASEVAADGSIALDKWRSGRFALLLTDCHMPQMDGFALTAAIRLAEGKTGPHKPIIAVTANAMQGEAQRCINSGMDDYLSKPLRLTELRTMLSKWLPLGHDEPLPASPGDPGSAASTDSGSGMDALPIWDANALTDRVGGNAAMQQRLLAKFLISARRQAASLKIAAQNSDIAQLAAEAHTLKSAARTVGAMALGELCQQIETSARAGDKATCELLASRVPGTLAKAEEKIEKILPDAP
jgi:PAS domain S-box-containing protein